MHPPTHFAMLPDLMDSWWLMAGFGAYHGLNPGIGWLFALALGLQQKNARAIWQSLLPISLGHALAVAVVAAVVFAAGRLVSTSLLRFVTAGLLLIFGAVKLFTYYRHPRWVGMRVGMRDLCVWSFIMAAAHGAGLMVAPTMLEIAAAGSRSAALDGAAGLLFGVGLHTAAMLTVMALVAGVVYYQFGLKILRQGWINFDLIWAVALLAAGATAVYFALGAAPHG